MPREWSGILMGDENLFHNSGSLPHVRRSIYHRFFRSAQHHSKFKQFDGDMAAKIPSVIPLTQTAQTSSSGQMIFDAAAPKIKYLLEIQPLNASDISIPSKIQALLSEAVTEIKPIYLSQLIQVSPDTPEIRSLLRLEIQKLNGQQKKVLFGQLKEDSSKGVFQGNTLLDLIVDTKAEYFAIVQTGRSSWPVQQGFVDRSIEASLDFFFSLNPDVGDIVKLLRTSYSFSTGIKIREYAINRVRNVDEFIRIARTEVEKTPEEYQQLQDQFTLRTLDKFLALNPSMADVMKLISASHGTDTGIEIRRKAIARIRTPEDFIKLIEGENETVPDEYRIKINQLAIDHIQIFLATKPDSKEMQKLMALTKKVDSAIEIRKVAMKLVRSAARYIELLEIEVENPTKEYVSALKQLRRDTETTFWELHPSIAEILAYLKGLDDVNESMRIRRRAFDLVTTPEDYLELFHFESDTPSKDYRNAVEKHFDETVDRFLAMDPSLELVNSLIPSVSTVERSMKLKRWMGQKVRSPSDFLQLADMKVASPSNSYRTAMVTLLNERNDVLQNVLTKPSHKSKLEALGWQATSPQSQGSNSSISPQHDGRIRRACASVLSKLTFWRKK